MLAAMSAYTFEIDDPDEAAAEIKGQIDCGKLKAHSLGIVSCTLDFVESGVVKAIKDAMPFEIVGCTSAGTAAAGELGEMMLSFTVLTSDTTSFSSGFSESLENDMDAALEKAWQKAVAERTEKPAIMLVFAPFNPNSCGEVIVESLNRITEGLPIFGTLAVSPAATTSGCVTIFNGEASETALSFALLYGDITPSFYVAEIPEHKVQTRRGVITKSKGNILQEVNNMPLVDYLAALGFHKEQGVWATMVPFMVDYNDGTKPVARSIFTITDDGYAICGGLMPENATISLGSLDYADVINTTLETVRSVSQKERDACLLMFACMYRYLMLGANTTAEMETVRKTVPSGQQYLFSYAGGEICPVYTETGTPVNRFHNCSLIVCAL